MKRVEIDPETTAELFQLTDDPSGVDNVYCEQPCADATGHCVVVRHNVVGGAGSKAALPISIVDLRDGSLRPVAETTTMFPGSPGLLDRLDAEHAGSCARPQPTAGVGYQHSQPVPAVTERGVKTREPQTLGSG